MNNFEKMKKNLSDQISNMTEKEFYQFISFLEEQYEYESDGTRHPILDMSEIFTCRACKQKFGCLNKDEDDENECERQFLQFCKE